MRYMHSFMLIVTNVLPAQWKSAGRTLRSYWQIYGGIKSLITSPYLALAVAVTIWARPYWSAKTDWVQNAIDIVPGMLGFSIGAFAILLVFASEKFLAIIADEGDDASVFMLTSSMFVHFIIVQVLSLLLAIGAKVDPSLSGIGFFMMLYAMFSGVSVGLALFNLAQLYNFAAHNIKNRQEPPA